MKKPHIIFMVILTLILLLSGNSCSANDTGKIVFLGPGEKNFHYIYSMDPDGTNLVKLARLLPHHMPYRNVWSAAGKTLAYVDYDDSTETAWLSVVESDGRNRRRVRDITDLKMESTALSPDGKTIVLSLGSTRITKIETPRGNTVHIEIIEEQDMDLFTVDVKTGELERLTDTPGVMEIFPSYSPDGKQIAFIGRIDTENMKNVPRDVFVMDADGSNRRLLAHHTDGQFVFNPDLCWSPDGSWIAYSYYNVSVSDCQHYYDIFVIDVDKSELINLTDSPHVIDSEPSWSPDGRKLAYYSGKLTEGPRVLIMDMDSGLITSLEQGWPSWTPDGKGLIFTNPLNVFELMIVDANGTNTRTLASTKDIRISRPIWLSE